MEMIWILVEIRDDKESVYIQPMKSAKEVLSHYTLFFNGLNRDVQKERTKRNFFGRFHLGTSLISNNLMILGHCFATERKS